MKDAPDPPEDSGPAIFGSAPAAHALVPAPDERLAAPVHTLAFASGRSLEIAELPGEERIHIRAQGGELLLALRLTPEGPVLSLSGVSLEIAAQKQLSLTCESLSIRSAGDASVDVGGSLRERIEGSAIREAGKACIDRAREVKVEAFPGGVIVQANDDVSITGERVRLNSDDPPMPLTWEEHRARRAAKLAAAGTESALAGLPDLGLPRLPDR